MKVLLPLATVVAAGLLAGCTPGPSQFEPAVEVTGRVKTADGKPVTDVKLTFNPMDKGLPVSPKLDKDGKFTAQIIPGKYTYAFEPADAKPAAFKLVPARYHTTAAEHTVRVEAGKEIVLTLS